MWCEAIQHVASVIAFYAEESNQNQLNNSSSFHRKNMAFRMNIDNNNSRNGKTGKTMVSFVYSF